MQRRICICARLAKPWEWALERLPPWPSALGGGSPRHFWRWTSPCTSSLRRLQGGLWTGTSTLQQALVAMSVCTLRLHVILEEALSNWSVDGLSCNRFTHEEFLVWYVRSISGNAATFYFLPMVLIASVVGLASTLAGIHHLRVWRTESLAAAASAALIAWTLTLLAFG